MFLPGFNPSTQETGANRSLKDQTGYTERYRLKIEGKKKTRKKQIARKEGRSKDRQCDSVSKNLYFYNNPHHTVLCVNFYKYVFAFLNNHMLSFLVSFWKFIAALLFLISKYFCMFTLYYKSIVLNLFGDWYFSCQQQYRDASPSCCLWAWAASLSTTRVSLVNSPWTKPNSGFKFCFYSQEKL